MNIVSERMQKGNMLFFYCWCTVFWEHANRLSQVGSGPGSHTHSLSGKDRGPWSPNIQLSASNSREGLYCFPVLSLPGPVRNLLCIHTEETSTPVLMPAGMRGQWFRYNGNLCGRLLVCNMPRSVNCRPQAPVGFSLVKWRLSYKKAEVCWVGLCVAPGGR